MLMLVTTRLLPTGVFDAVKGSYTFAMTSNTPDTYLVILSLRHPNVSGSFTMTKFHLAVVPNPAAVTAATTNTSTTTDLSTVTAASVALFNPLVNPQVSYVVRFPQLLVSAYAGGGAKALADFKAVVAATGSLDGPAWVQAVVLPGAQLTVNTTVSVVLACLCWCAYVCVHACMGACVCVHVHPCALMCASVLASYAAVLVGHSPSCSSYPCNAC